MFSTNALEADLVTHSVLGRGTHNVATACRSGPAPVG